MRCVRATVAVLLVPVLAGAAGPLVTTPADYLILGQKTATLKDIIVSGPGCNLGVNCPHATPNAKCGTLKVKDANVAQPGQTVGDQMCGPGAFWEVFRNNVSQCDPTFAMISNPGINLDGSEPFAAPILANADADPNPSCNPLCEIDREDFAAACGTTLPFPTCDPLKPVVVVPDADCAPYDSLLGNFRCDLPPDDYGKIKVIAGGSLSFDAGTHSACGLAAGTGSRVTSLGDASVFVSVKDRIKLNNNGEHGCGCGHLKLFSERGMISLGKRGEVDVDACSIDGTIALGKENALRGHFFGVKVRGDHGNVGHCCAVPSASSVSGAFTHTAEFWKGHPTLTQAVLTGAGGSIGVCGKTLTDLDIDHGHSVREALCVKIADDPRLLLFKELTAAALNAAVSGAVFSDLALCTGHCSSGVATPAEVDDCITRTRAFNCSGEHLASTLEPSGPNDAIGVACGAATSNLCNALFTGGCVVP